MNDVYDMNLGIVDRPDEGAGLLEQVFADVAHIDPDDQDDAATAGLRAFDALVHGGLRVGSGGVSRSIRRAWPFGIRRPRAFFRRDVVVN